MGLCPFESFIEGGHVPSCDVYIHSLQTQLRNRPFKDHGDQMEGSRSCNSVASVSFIERQAIGVNKDGVLLFEIYILFAMQRRALKWTVIITFRRIDHCLGLYCFSGVQKMV